MAEKVREGLQAVGLAPEEWAPYSPAPAGDSAAGTEALVGISPETLKGKTFEALRQICLHRSQQHPLILAVENLHWIDPTSEAFFARLVDSIAGAPILALATYRPGYQAPWVEKSYATQLTLAPLSPKDCVQILRAVLSTESVPEALAQEVVTKAQGNPFFLEEIAQTLVEQGDSETQWREGSHPRHAAARDRAGSTGGAHRPSASRREGAAAGAGGDWQNMFTQSAAAGHGAA